MGKKGEWKVDREGGMNKRMIMMMVGFWHNSNMGNIRDLYLPIVRWTDHVKGLTV